MSEESLIRFVDVGALGGIDKKWSDPGRIWPILFEPNAIEAERLRAKYPRGTVIECALGASTEERLLHITKNPTCTSLLRPDRDFLHQYGIRPHFEVEAVETVKCSRYDELFLKGAVPSPDVIKIDAQGFEFEVLLGFGGLLHNVLGVELETHFYPIYQHQKTFSDLIKLLGSYDFRLRKIDCNKMGNFDGDLVEVDAYFTKVRHIRQRFEARQKGKFAMMASVWDIGQ